MFFSPLKAVQRGVKVKALATRTAITLHTTGGQKSLSQGVRLVRVSGWFSFSSADYIATSFLPYSGKKRQHRGNLG